MSRYDLLIRNGMLVTQGGPIRSDLAIEDGLIVALAASLDGSGKDEIDATGQHILPGVIDPHLHFNEPGRTHWEGFATGTRALAAGGTTCFFDMPLNAHPPTIDAASFDLKLAAAQANSLVDFAFWGGLVPGNVERLPELAERGVIGYKAFMSNSGIDDFSAVDYTTLYEGMAMAAKLGLPVAVHAENEQLTATLAEQALKAGRTGIRDYLRSRPALAEYEAIEQAIHFAKETACSLHIVHVSTGRGVTLVAEARAQGLDVTCETCPHYLVLTEDDLETLGPIAKCAPPLRSQTEQDALWTHLISGLLPMVASDHSPAPADLKTSQNFFEVWGGISGCQSLLQLLLTEGHCQREVPLSRLVNVTSAASAHRFGLYPRKGSLAPGSEADLVLLNLTQEHILQADDLYYRHQHSPYVGRSFRGRIRRTLLRGQAVFQDGHFRQSPLGRLIKPASYA